MYKEYVAVFFSIIFASMMIGFPQIGMEAVRDVIGLWGLTVVPSLFPFFLCSNFMIEIGFIDKLSKACDKIIRKLFNTSGSCGFAFIMSLVSGYPVGIKILSDLRTSGRISKVEGEIGMTFCSTSGPLFMVGAVGVGMLGSTAVGWIIALSHYFGAIINGLFYGKILGKKKSANNILYIEEKNKLIKADRNKSNLNTKDVSDSVKDYNNIVGKSIFDSVNTLFLIFGYMTLFMMIIYFINQFFDDVSFWVPGILELSVGCREAAGLLYCSSIQKCLICTALVSFGGLCVIFQSLSFLGKSDLSLKLFIMSKVTHGIFASIIAFLICRSINWIKPEILSVFSYGANNSGVFATEYLSKNGYIYNLLFSGGMVCGLAVIFVIIVSMYKICTFIRKKVSKK